MTSRWTASTSPPASWRDQRPHHLGRLALPGRRPVRVAARGAGGQRQRQRRAARPLGQLGRPRGVRHPLGAEQRARVAVAQGPELQLHGHVLPAPLAPARIGRAAPRDDHDARVRQVRQHLAAQVPAQRRHPLVGVQDHQRPLERVGPGKRVVQRVGHRRQVAALDQQRGPPRLPPALGHAPQQRALADPAGTVHQHHVRRRVVHEERVQEAQLGPAADERGLVAAGHPGAERHGRRSNYAGAARSASVRSSSQLHSAGLPGQSAHRPRCGSAVGSKRPSVTPAVSSRSSASSAGTSSAV